MVASLTCHIKFLGTLLNKQAIDNVIDLQMVAPLNELFLIRDCVAKIGSEPLPAPHPVIDEMAYVIFQNFHLTLLSVLV